MTLINILNVKVYKNAPAYSVYYNASVKRIMVTTFLMENITENPDLKEAY